MFLFAKTARNSDIYSLALGFSSIHIQSTVTLLIAKESIYFLRDKTKVTLTGVISCVLVALYLCVIKGKDMSGTE